MTVSTCPLTPAQLDAFGEELDAIRAAVVADLGQPDVDYITRLIRVQRGLEVAGRGLLFLGFLPRPGSEGRPPCRCRRSWTTWRSATTSCMANTTGPGISDSAARPLSGTRRVRLTSGATPITTCTTRTRTSSVRTATSATASFGCPRRSAGAPTTSATSVGHTARPVLPVRRRASRPRERADRDRRGRAQRSAGCSATSGARSKARR